MLDSSRFTDRSDGARLAAVLIVWILLGSALSCLRAPGRNSAAGGSKDATNATVTEVVDGDTIKATFRGRDITVRLIGLDAPEVAGPYTSTECFGPKASEFTTQALDGQPVRLEFDVEELDRFGRTLAYVWLGDRLFNEELLRGGFAIVATFPPNVAYVDRFRSAEREARAHDRGLWDGCEPGSR